MSRSASAGRDWLYTNRESGSYDDSGYLFNLENLALLPDII